VKCTRGRIHGKLGKSCFRKYLFPWSDWLHQKRVFKLSKNLDWNPSRWIFPLHFLPRKQWFCSHSLTPCRFLETNSSWKMAWLVSEKIYVCWFFLIFLWNTLEKSSKHCHFTHQIAISRNPLVHAMSDFLYTKFLFSNHLDCWLILKLFKN